MKYKLQISFSVSLRYIALPLILWIISGPVHAAVKFDIVTAANKVSIVYAADDKKLDSIAANLLANDIASVTGFRPKVTTELNTVSGNVILIGTIDSKLIRSLNDPYFNGLNGKWECYGQKLISNPFKNIRQALVIAGSDVRGTTYGVFSLSEKIGVSPWYWWADVTPAKRPVLSVDIDAYISSPPSVKFRGIFINDEDWGLQPWAAKNFEPETGDIGPKTYAKVFELLLRLKANLIWPAMHPSTKAFYHYPGNVKVAEDYQIVVGSSHAEPMLRNNVGEWNEKTMGAFNYLTNQQKVDDYWESRVKESSNFNGIYTIGMRGVHDSGIEGVKTVAETVPLLERIFKDQREMLKKYVNPDVTKVPQAFTAYKEVLDVYDGGLKVPDDVTLVWPDDNYGYIQRLSNPDESKRAGGAGVYYHVSYWGRPHDYLWLSTTHPALIREEMMKAYDMNARNIWVLNVGDIKPAEYNIQLFMDMAYQAQPFADPSYVKNHLTNWAGKTFGSSNAKKAADILWKYYDLAFERKPEFMGWSGTEPTTKTTFTAYNPNAYGDQGQIRIDNYAVLTKQTDELYNNIPANLKDAYYQLVKYPVTGAALMNQKFLYRDKANLYGQLGGICAAQYAALSDSAYQGIKKETEIYNTKIANGKWKGIMSMAPRKLPVFDPAEIKLPPAATQGKVLILPEGGAERDSAGLYHLLKQAPLNFDRWSKGQHFVDLALQKETSINYTVTGNALWLKLPQNGTLLPTAGRSIQRLWVDIDWPKVPKSLINTFFVINADGQMDTINLKVDNRELKEMQSYNGYVLVHGQATINPANFSDGKKDGLNEWRVIDGLGSGGKALEAMPLTMQANAKKVDTANIRSHASVSYSFYTLDKGTAKFTITTLPTFAINNGQGVRYAISIDNGPLTVLDFKTFGRSEEWKANVLSNSANRSVSSTISTGKHLLTIYMVDPGVIIDRLTISLGRSPSFYGALPVLVKQQ